MLGHNDLLYTVIVETGINTIDATTLKPLVSSTKRSSGSENSTHMVWCQIRGESDRWTKPIWLKRSSNHNDAFQVSQASRRILCKSVDHDAAWNSFETGPHLAFAHVCSVLPRAALLFEAF